MIKSLTYEVVFPTGRTLKRSLDFKSGLTAICGPNESGKTFVIEVIRWCLFGTKALRGDADDYKSLKAKLIFSIKGVEYVVERSSSNAKISTADSQVLAVGTRPVNDKILSLFGYGLNVFDVAHVANQGDVMRLGDMLPTERKKMVDQLIGLDRIDDVSKWVAEQATLLNREIEVLERSLGEQPTPPVAPGDYLPADDILAKINEIRKVKTELDQLKGWLSQSRTQPTMPVPTSAPDMMTIEAEIQRINANHAECKRIMAIPVIDYDPAEVTAQWEAWDRWQERNAFEKANPFHSLIPETSEDLLAKHALCDERDRLQKQKASLEKSGKATCPSCSTEFCLAHDALAPITSRLVELDDVQRPIMSVADLQEELRRHANWARPEISDRWEELEDVVEVVRPAHPRQAPAGAISRVERQKLLDALPPAESTDPWVKHRKDRQLYEAAVAVYERDIGPYECWVAERAVKQARAAELEPIVAALAELEDHHRRCVAYEQQARTFLDAMAQWEKKRDEVNEKLRDAAGWKQAKAFIAELRTRIKGHLTPSLSKVASHLITQMTGGARTSIIVDPDFEIRVDGQKLNTLSGSGKACANLALRIGLGQVLTNNVMSIFIGDEVDASMDQSRADYVQELLGTLTKNISQIFIITHKLPSADNVIAFEGALNVGQLHP